MAFAPKIAPGSTQANAPAVQSQTEQEQMQMQENSGNESSLQKMHAGIQAKLNIGKPGDKFEQEADNTAARVMSKPQSNVQLQSAEPEEVQQMTEESPSAEATNDEEGAVSTKSLLQPLLFDDEKDVPNDMLNAKEDSSSEVLTQEENVQAKASREEPGVEFEDKLNNSKGGGEKLPADTQGEMENRFGGKDFSNVRVHTDSASVDMNKDVKSKAFTNENHIFFNSGQFSNSDSGKELLAHELTHTIQQGATEDKVQAKENEKEEKKVNDPTAEKGDKKVEEKTGDEGPIEGGDPLAAELGIHEEYTSQIISGKEDNKIQRKVDDYKHSEDVTGPENRVKERMEEDGVDPNAKPEPDDERPASDEINEQESEVSEDAKPDVNRPQKNTPELNQRSEKLAKEVEKERDINAEEKKVEEPQQKKAPKTPAEIAKAQAAAAFAKAETFTPPAEPKEVEVPEIKPAVDSEGKEVESNPVNELRVAALTAQLQIYRKKAYDLKTGAEVEKAKAEELTGILHAGYAGIYQSNEVIDKNLLDFETHKEHVEGMEVHRDEAERRADWVAAEAPAMIETANESSLETASLNSDLKEEEQKSDQVPEDPEASEDSAEAKGEMENSGEDAATADATMKDMSEKAAPDLLSEALVAKEKNAVTTEKLNKAKENIATSEAKLHADKALNVEAKASFDAMDKEPEMHRKKAEKQEKQADKAIKKSFQQEKKLHAMQREYYAAMSQVPGAGRQEEDPSSNDTIQRKPLTDDDAQLYLNDPVARQKHLDSINNDYNKALFENELEMRENFETMSGGEKGWYALSVSGNNIAAYFSEVGFSGFLVDMVSVALNPLPFMAQLMNPDYSNDPWFIKPLRFTSGLITSLLVGFGSLWLLSTILAGIGTALSWWPFTAIIGIPMMSFFFPLAEFAGAVAEMLLPISMDLNALMFMLDLAKAACAQTSTGLAQTSEQVSEDVTRGMVSVTATIGARVGPKIGGLLKGTRVGKWFGNFKTWSGGRVAMSKTKLGGKFGGVKTRFGNMMKSGKTRFGNAMKSGKTRLRNIFKGSKVRNKPVEENLNLKKLTAETRTAISEIAKKYGIFECKECVAEMVETLKDIGVTGEILDVKTPTNKGMSGNIWSDALQKNISVNGTHQAIMVDGIVFDNINPGGISYNSWFNDLFAPQGFKVTRTNF
ncbi:MAG: DUF4157 domain-containing protein [Bacteroidetes bacterium]|nr:DUF4157 domain-containing protein [Bacteroidota bacterium]